MIVSSRQYRLVIVEFQQRRRRVMAERLPGGKKQELAGDRGAQLPLLTLTMVVPALIPRDAAPQPGKV